MIYMPAVIDTYSRRYGLFGVTLALVGWLLVVSMIVVAAAIVAAELDRASEPWARRLRESLGVETEGVPATSHEAGGPEPSPRPDR
jgi:membrane protein